MSFFIISHRILAFDDSIYCLEQLTIFDKHEIKIFLALFGDTVVIPCTMALSYFLRIFFHIALLL